MSILAGSSTLLNRPILPSNQTPLGALPARFRRVRVLVVEDHPRILSFVKKGLEEDGFVVIRVRDHGPGIPEGELPFVKKKFYKGSSKERGSGIGLAVCDEIVARHGGELVIENAEGGGVRAIVRLPAPRHSNSERTL